MGAFLDKPKMEKEVARGSGNGLIYGLCSMQGWRIEMEDAHCAMVGLPRGLDDWSFFAVFDGHAGANVSSHCSSNLLDYIIKVDQFVQHASKGNVPITPEELDQIKQSIRSGFLALDEEMKELPQVVSGEDKSGSTAICSLASPTHLFIANCGDSRAVVSRSGSCVFATSDHKPVNPEEKERIVNAGGSVMIQRVNGSLAVSRALGDYEYKMVEGKGPCEQLVSPEPEVTVLDRDLENDEFLILACDGVWDVMTNTELCDYVRYMLTITEDMEQICSSIVDTCFHKGSKDNMSVVLVVFPNAPKVSVEAQQKDAQLDQTLRVRIQEILAKTKEHSLSMVIQDILNDKMDGLPPGGGLESKRNTIESIYTKLGGGANSGAFSSKADK